LQCACNAEDKIDVKKLESNNLSILETTKNRDCKGYYLLMRETTNAFSRKKYLLRPEITVPHSKDTTFAVQSVNADNESYP
jgi:hypothetical protein